MPGEWLVIDEPWMLFEEVSFETKWQIDNTTASKLRTLIGGAGAVGAHVLIISQRFQVSDVPTIMRSALDLRITHKLSAADATLVALPEATLLPPGQCFVSNHPFSGPVSHVGTELGQSRIQMPLLCEPKKLFLIP